ncbi:nuclear transport factor 2 family protein [Weissella ceti]|uniref:Nuclear transport factor 2 family protein n=1 Tax=Weissella ceti TaxID=759620 RepID=A0ABT3E253_9LACO|nr:nuclear transport factor 2 family protein [Weissella ceti]MCW0952503.1 nuclear transport factor 2 family protein [Weissella ceti]QVK11828.1 nuclear transport factor 2 family protein [Weissella ceti]
MNNYQEIVANTYKLMAQGKIAEFKAALANDIVWREATGAPYAGEFIGPDAVVENVHARLNADWADFKAIDDVYAVNGNTVFVYGEYSGINRQTGKAFSAPFVHLYEINADDKVASFTQITDTKLMWDAM